MGYIENCHKAPTFLEKDGESKKFLTQPEVDQAWADGWFAPGRPDSAEKAAGDGLGEQNLKKSDKLVAKKSKSRIKRKKAQIEDKK